MLKPEDISAIRENLEGFQKFGAESNYMELLDSIPALLEHIEELEAKLAEKTNIPGVVRHPCGCMLPFGYNCLVDHSRRTPHENYLPGNL